jgi:hypothetical protein
MPSSPIAPDSLIEGVSAVVLTIGETTTARAIESINRQTFPISEIIVVRDETPFHVALNKGVAGVRTRFFVQVDADMILDSDCIEFLMSSAFDTVGIVAGSLRDPLIGRVCCVKLFRTACFARTGFPNSLSPDTDFAREIGDQGYSTVYAIRADHSDRSHDHTFGQHSPDYSIDYTFLKHLVEGRRYVYRNAFHSCRWHMWQLEKQQSETSLIAQIAIAHGIFLGGREDRLVPYGDSSDRAHLEVLEKRVAQTPSKFVPRLIAALRFVFSSKSAFERHFRLGTELARVGSWHHMRSWLLSYGGRTSVPDIIAKIAFSHGLFQPSHLSSDALAKQDHLRRLIGDEWPARSIFDALRSRLNDAKNALLLP